MERKPSPRRVGLVLAAVIVVLEIATSLLEALGLGDWTAWAVAGLVTFALLPVLDRLVVRAMGEDQATGWSKSEAREQLWLAVVVGSIGGLVCLGVAYWATGWWPVLVGAALLVPVLVWAVRRHREARSEASQGARGESS